MTAEAVLEAEVAAVLMVVSPADVPSDVVPPAVVPPTVVPNPLVVSESDVVPTIDVDVEPPADDPSVVNPREEINAFIDLVVGPVKSA
jgi:hypothetical protein